MKLYHKIQSLFKRDKRGKFIMGQWATDEIGFLKEQEWVWTEKIDGTNVRVGWGEDGRFRYGGRTEKAQMPITLMERLQEVLPEDRVRGVFNGDEDVSVCLYGEGCGAKIQKGGGNYREDGNDFVLFDVMVGKWWLKREDVNEVAEQLGVQSVPRILTAPIARAITLVEQGLLSRWGNFEAEGLVGRPVIDLFARNGDRIITKVKAKDIRKV